MLKHNDVNPLNVFGMRKFDHLAPHLFKVVFDLKTKEKTISDWVYENLDGRFWMGQFFHHTDTGMEMSYCAAFENHSEASYFSLMLDQFNKSYY